MIKSLKLSAAGGGWEPRVKIGLKTIGLSLVTIVLANCSFLAKPAPSPTPEPSPPPRVQALSFDPDAPHVSLWPREDALGLTITINGADEYQVIEAKVQYQTSEGRSQGFLKTLPSAGKKVVKGEGIFGSCSRGVCKYDQGVDQGSVELAFRKSDGSESFWKTGFKIALLAAGEGVSSTDGKLNYRADLSGAVIIHKLLGLPEPRLDLYQDYGYGVYNQAGVAQGEVALAFFELPEKFEQLEIAYWDGQEWKTAKTEADLTQKRLTARVSGSPIVVTTSS